ncbi:hypothetical protein [Moorena sp. SIO3I6]|nr:hypothetical protein [Moorena sp. SIO3I6]
MPVPPKMPIPGNWQDASSTQDAHSTRWSNDHKDLIINIWAM